MAVDLKRLEYAMTPEAVELLTQVVGDRENPVSRELRKIIEGVLSRPDGESVGVGMIASAMNSVAGANPEVRSPYVVAAMLDVTAEIRDVELGAVERVFKAV